MDLPDTIYCDCKIVNNDQQNPQRLIFNDIRSSPILSNPELYQLSVIRFTMETGNILPIFQPRHISPTTKNEKCKVNNFFKSMSRG